MYPKVQYDVRKRLTLDCILSPIKSVPIIMPGTLQAHFNIILVAVPTSLFCQFWPGLCVLASPVCCPVHQLIL
jgi:hypothetical protein